MGEHFRSHADGRDRDGSCGKHHGRACKLKKVPEPSDEAEKDPVTLTTLTVGGISRGLDLEGIKEMTIGQLVDFCIEWNEINNPTEEKDEAKGRTRKDKNGKRIRTATQADWDAFWG